MYQNRVIPCPCVFVTVFFYDAVAVKDLKKELFFNPAPILIARGVPLLKEKGLFRCHCLGLSQSDVSLASIVTTLHHGFSYHF